ncbi:hypothetical protein Rleg9DRAFT_6183 [Rhizobium leguminosarum bv. trifolii WSM597]|uniref:Uncharacterized protein n=1 Tax=Rhizobium leguminosarum bv. trifolii WSM597 TaxID=754764 RepID=J0H9U6_RHILT|nr:hypothetical protein Rleg9DRAFT_6183 [Rhizobium leguminosarum bv. trifolii WSM597]
MGFHLKGVLLPLRLCADQTGLRRMWRRVSVSEPTKAMTMSGPVTPKKGSGNDRYRKS